MIHEHVDVPLQQLRASLVFAKAKARAGIRGIAMYVTLEDGRPTATFSAELGYQQYRFQLRVSPYEIDDARDVIAVLTLRMVGAWKQFLGAADSWAIAEWLKPC
jgi:hypothetical protein